MGGGRVDTDTKSVSRTPFAPLCRYSPPGCQTRLVQVFVSKTVPVILTKRLTGLGMEGEVRLQRTGWLGEN